MGDNQPWGNRSNYRMSLSATPEMSLKYRNAALPARLSSGPHSASRLSLCYEAIEQGESFVFETVLSDPIRDKVNMLAQCIAKGHQDVLFSIEIEDAKTLIDRVSMRVSQGGHDFPIEKLQTRFSRTQANLRRAIKRLPYVLVYDNSDLHRPYRFVRRYCQGTQVGP